MYIDNLKNRVTVRKYASRDVEQKLLNEILEAAERTQTMGNLQLYSVVVTRSEEMKNKLAPAHFNQPMVKGAPVVLTVCADFHRTTRWCEERNAQPGYNNFLSFLNAMTDALLYTQTLCCLAEERGLGVCFLGTTLYNPQTIVDVLQLPKLVMPVATITLGYPDEQPALTDRLPLQSMVFDEHYPVLDAPAIDEAYHYKESLPENQHFVELNHKESLAQVFTDLRYTKKDNEFMSAAFIETLRKQGFMD